MVALDRLADILIDELGAAFPDRRLLGAWLYGSRARGEERAGSDIDIAVFSDSPLEHRLGDFEDLCRELSPTS